MPGLALGWGCDDGPAAPDPPEDGIGMVVGTVRVATTGQGVAGAVVSVGTVSATTGTDGRYELTDLAAGPITIRATAAGFEDFELSTTIPDFRVTRDLSLTRRESFAFGDYALFAPAGPRQLRGVLVALGGPDTRGFAAGTPFGAPVPEVEAALQDLGGRFRGLAASREIAVLGTSIAAMPNGPASDETLLDALREAATVSGRPELADAPLLLYGLSGGAPQASGFMARNPERIAALFLKVPAAVEPISGAALDVPAYMVMAELDAFVDNDALTSSFEAVRGAGGPWARALERNVVHHSLSPAQRTFTVGWMNTILDLRLGRTATSPLQSVESSSGWLGDAVNGDIAPWAEFKGDPGSASWLPTEATAEEWQSLGAVRGPSGHTLAVDRSALTVSVGRIDDMTARVFDGAGRQVDDPVVRFTSNAEEFVRVYNDSEWCEPSCGLSGVVLAVAPGIATVTAEYEGARAEVVVTVVPAVGTLVIEPAEATIAVGGTIVLTVKLLDENGDEIPNPPGWISWNWSDWDWDTWFTIASVTYVPDTDQWQLQLTGLVPGTVLYSASLVGPLGPDPQTETHALLKVE